MFIKVIIDHERELCVWVEGIEHLGRIARIVDSGDFDGWEYVS
jgi:hypothetical protein